MAGLKWTVWCGIAGAAILATLWILPSTQWVVRGHLSTVPDVLRKEDENRLTIKILDTLGGVDPDALLRRYLPNQARTVRQEVLQAELLQDGRRRVQALGALSDEYPRDAFVQAEACRYACDGMDPFGKELAVVRRNDPSRKEERRESDRIVLKASERGSATDPNNMHFDVLRAAALVDLGDRRAARAAFMRASEKTGLDDYLTEVRAMRLEPLRGASVCNYCKLNCAVIAVGPYELYTRLVKWIIDEGTEKERIETRIHVLKLADSMASQSKGLGGFLAAGRMLGMVVGWDEWGSRTRSATLPRRNEAASPQAASQLGTQEERDSRCVDAARELQRKAFAAGVAIKGFEAEEGAKRILSYMRAWRVVLDRDRDTDNASAEGPWASTLRAVKIAALFPALLAVTAGFFVVGQIIRRKDVIARLTVLVLPALVLCAAIWDDETRRHPTTWVLAGLIVAATVTALRDKDERKHDVTTWLGLLFGAVACALFRSTEPAILFVVFAVPWGVGWALSRDVSGPDWHAWTVIALELCGLAGLATVYVCNDGIEVDRWFMIVGVLACPALVGPRERKPAFAILGPALLASALAYAFCVRTVVVQDRGLAAYLASVGRSGDEVRAAARGLDPRIEEAPNSRGR